MARFKNLLKRKRFKNWDEAFRSLTPQMRQHSVRVAEYTKVLFEGVCKSSVYLKDPETPIYADNTFAEVAYKCGFFHQIGKALAPEDYPAWRDDFEDEEKSRYCKYVVEGRELVELLQGENVDPNTSDQMIQDACEYHMERWDGSGFPYGYVGNEISLIAQIVGLAKEMDQLVCERKSETPFEDAVDRLLAEEGKQFSPQLMDVFRSQQSELRNIYKKYIHYTKIMPKTVPLVEKRLDRPFGLNYRQIVGGKDWSGLLFEATPWFRGVTGQPDKKECAQETEQLLFRTGLIQDVTQYLLYEAADLLVRIQNCELPNEGVLIPIFSDFYSGDNQWERLEKLYEDTGIDRKRLLLTVPEQLLRKEPSVSSRLTEYIEHGVALLLDDYHPEALPISYIREIGITHVRLAKDVTAPGDWIQELKNRGIKTIDWPTGDTWLSEDELIRYLMELEKTKGGC